MAGKLGQRHRRCPLTEVRLPATDTGSAIDERYLTVDGDTVVHGFDVGSCTITAPSSMAAVFGIHPSKYDLRVVPFMAQAVTPVASAAVQTVDGRLVRLQAGNHLDLQRAGELYRADLAQRRTAHLRAPVVTPGPVSAGGGVAQAYLGEPVEQPDGDGPIFEVDSAERARRRRLLP